MAKPILDKACAEQSIAEPKTNNDEKFELSKELLTELRKVESYEGLMDDIISSDEEWEEHEYGNPPNTIADSSSKPYLGAHHKGDASDHKKCNGNTSELESNILNKAPHSGGIVA
ncbi:hypothetical protein Tco_0255989 [Tanacetum coccineum]